MDNQKIIIGTSGYDYPSWQGIFYPQNIKRRDFLAYYATKFNGVEINSTFYAMPTAKQSKNLLTRCEGKLQFSIKANKVFTHQLCQNFYPYGQEFMAGIAPLLECGSLSCVLFQFPQSFHYIPANRIYLDKLLFLFQNVPTVVEFRHCSWCKQSVYNGLQNRNVSLVFCDMPALKNLPQGLALSTPFVGHMAYLRLHGRNADAWYTKDNTNNGQARYDYEYSENELNQFVPVINFATNQHKKTFIFFNNHPNGSGAKNAIQLQNILMQNK